MSETVKNKHVKKKNSAVLLLKTVIQRFFFSLPGIYAVTLWNIRKMQQIR